MFKSNFNILNIYIVEGVEKYNNVLSSSMGLKEKRPEKSFTGLPSLKL